MPVPSSLALTNIADGASIVAADHRNNYTAIQAAVNALIGFFAAGSTGATLRYNGTDWAKTANILLDDTLKKITLGTSTWYEASAGVLKTDGSITINAYTLSNANAGIQVNGRFTVGDPVLYLGSAGDASMSRYAANQVGVGASAPVSSALLGVVGGTLGNGLEWGNSGNVAFRSVLGNDAASGQNFLVFYGEHGTNAATYRSRGTKSSIIQPDATGGFQFGNVANASADNQTFVTTATLSSAGVFQADLKTAIASVTSARTGGAAAAIPANPVRYLALQDENGNRMYVPAYS